MTDTIESLHQQLAEAQEQVDLQIPKEVLIQLKQQLAECQAELQSTRLQMITDFGQYQEAHEKVKELTAEVERLKGEQYVQLDIHTDDTRTKQQRELDGAMEVGQLLADSENSTASNSAFKGTEHLTWVHTGNGYISDSSGRFIGAFSGDFRNRDRFICAVNSENQLRQQNAELTAQINNLKAQIAHLEYQYRP